MLAKNYKIGTRIKNKQTGAILEVMPVTLDKYKLENMWVDVEYGDIFSWVNEDLYKEY